jgi:hypothetical protein
MLNLLLPPRIDNSYRGHTLALWLFGLVVSVRIAQSVALIVGGRAVLTSADGIPFGTFTPAASQTVVALWTLLALSRLFVLLPCALALLRYRSAISVMFLLLLLNYLAAQLSLQFIPIVTTGTPPGPLVNLMLAALMIVGLALSLWHRDDRSVNAIAESRSAAGAR